MLKATGSSDISYEFYHRMIWSKTGRLNTVAGPTKSSFIRLSWEAFFKHSEKSGIFEIEKLDVTTGTDVAYATALWHCGTEEELKKGR